MEPNSENDPLTETEILSEKERKIQKFHRIIRIFIFIYLVFPMIFQGLYGYINGLLFIFASFVPGESVAFNILNGIHYLIVGTIFIGVAVFLIVCTAKRKLYRLTFMGIFLHSAYNVMTVAGATYVTIRSPIFARAPNAGELGFFFITIFFGIISYTGCKKPFFFKLNYQFYLVFTSTAYYLTRPKKYREKFYWC